MVGAPKHLHDLNRINADVRVTCRSCGFEVDWSVADLSAHLIAIGGNLAWSEVTRRLSCGRQGCSSRQLKATAVARDRRQPNLRQGVSKLDVRLIAVAIDILDDATARSPGRDVATVAVRLALLVTFAIIRDAGPTRMFWERAGNAGRVASEGLQDPLAIIRHRLTKLGYFAESPSPQPVRTWPWDSPAPPGWLSGSGLEGRERD